jgi:hypothetical protein
VTKKVVSLIIVSTYRIFFFLDQITSSGSGADSDDENEFVDDDEQEGLLRNSCLSFSYENITINLGQASPALNVTSSSPTQDHAELDQTNTVGNQLPGEVTETERRFYVPMENPHQTRVYPMCSTGIRIPKSRNPAHSSGESSDEQTA